MDESKDLASALSRLRALSHYGEWKDQDTNGWKGPYPLPEVIRSYFSPLGPVEVSIQCLTNPVILYSFEGVNTWTRRKRMKEFSPVLLEGTSPIVLVQGESDSILWADGRVAACPIYYSETLQPARITDALGISSGFREFLLALAHLGEAIGGDSVAFVDKYFTEYIYPTKECEKAFLPVFTKILGSAEFGAAFMQVFFGER